MLDSFTEYHRELFSDSVGLWGALRFCTNNEVPIDIRRKYYVSEDYKKSRKGYYHSLEKFSEFSRFDMKFSYRVKVCSCQGQTSFPLKRAGNVLYFEYIDDLAKASGESSFSGVTFIPGNGGFYALNLSELPGDQCFERQAKDIETEILNKVIGFYKYEEPANIHGLCKKQGPFKGKVTLSLEFTAQRERGRLGAVASSGEAAQADLLVGSDARVNGTARRLPQRSHHGGFPDAREYWTGQRSQYQTGAIVSEYQKTMAHYGFQGASLRAAPASHT